MQDIWVVFPLFVWSTSCAVETILVILKFIDAKPNTELLISFGTSSGRSCDAICRVGSIHPDLIG